MLNRPAARDPAGASGDPAASDASTSGALLPLLRTLSWPELRHHPWRHLAALVAVMLGVALSFSVQVINRSALSEFGSAVRAVNGQPDFEIRGPRDGFDESVYARVARHPQVAAANPVIEIEATEVGGGEPVPVRVVGVDALSVAGIAPALMPRPDEGADRMAVLSPDAVFVNAALRQRLGGRQTLALQAPGGVRVSLPVRGSLSASGLPLAVMDVAGAQVHFGWLGRLNRIDVRLATGADAARVARELALPEGVRIASPEEATERISNVSRAYRVNLTVLALVALFTGSFLVFSILSLSVIQRQPQLALLGVLGLPARGRLGLVLAESAVLGAAGSVAGLLLGAALADVALRFLAGDLGGGYFPGVTPTLHVDALDAAVHLALGTGAALAGGWLPARAAARLVPAQALKGWGTAAPSGAAGWLGALLLPVGVALALLPPVGGLPIAAYLSVACLLLGGIACVPAGVALLLRGVAPPTRPLALLAVERARHQRGSATIAVAGVVASLALAVALTVMVSSFREAVTRWLDTVLPADLYARAAAARGSNSEVAVLPTALPDRAARIPGVQRVAAQRVTSVQLDPAQPSVALISRPLGDPTATLPLVGELLALPAGATAAYASEAMVDLYGARPGRTLLLPLADGRRVPVFVRGVWRDYARQHGAVLCDAADYRRFSGDARINDLALWLAPGATAAAVERELRRVAAELGADADTLDIASAAEIRTVSLHIFDRSFAVTYWLQAVAIGIGLFGIAASFSAQVLARRKELGLLAHLGLTRRQILGVVTAEGAVWTAAGTVLGLALGLAVSVVLVKVVNPQSFHWTMELLVPTGRLALLGGAVLAAGTGTAWWAARAAARGNLALAVKEDW